MSASLGITGGDGRDRTADLLIANQSLSQLSYAPSYTIKSYVSGRLASIAVRAMAIT